MSADFTLYAVTESEWPRWEYLSNVKSWVFSNEEDDNSDELEEFHSLLQCLHNENRVMFIGEVSFLKASLTGDYDKFIPGPVQGVLETICKNLGNPLTERIVKSIIVSMNKPNKSIYKHRYVYLHPQDGWTHRNYGKEQQRSCGVQRARVVKKWLTNHIGYRLSYQNE